MIYNSFQSWNESPVKTTVETLPISEITFPKVTVCPPKNTYTDLNYDLMMTENMTLDNDTRQELTNFAAEMLYDHLYDIVMKNLSKLEDNDRYYNWYTGYTEILLPYFISSNDIYGRRVGVHYDVYTTATSGTVSTQYFGEEFDADKVETGPLSYRVNVNTPASVRNNPNVTLHLNIERVSLKDLSSGHDTLYLLGTRDETSHYSHNYTAPTEYTYTTELDREVLPADVMKQKLSQMPGYRVTWHYSGMEVEPWAEYYNYKYLYSTTMAFIRNYSNNIQK